MVPGPFPFSVDSVSWLTAASELHTVRRAVFIAEQGVPEELEWDDQDVVASHVLARSSDGRPIGTGRLKPDCYVGRMAVLKSWRGHGVGGAILKRLLDVA